MSLFYIGHPNDHDLALFAGGELGPVARWRIEKHLQSCSRCEEAVADFFHLQSELGELSELPNVDWTAQAQMILDRADRARAANDKAPTPSLGQSWALRAGLAMATVICAVVIVRQLPLQKAETELASKTNLSRAIHEQVAVQSIPEQDANRKEMEEARSSAAPVATVLSESAIAENKQVAGAQLEGGERARSNFGEEFASARRESDLAPDLTAPVAPTGFRKTQAGAPAAPAPPMTLAYQASDRRVSEDKRDAAPAEAAVGNEGVGRGQAASAVTQSAENQRRISARAAANTAADEFALADRADRQAPPREQGKGKTEMPAGAGEAAQKAQTPLQIAAARTSGGAVGSLANTGPAAAQGAATRYSIVPVGSGSQVETGVAADGAISFRTVDATTGTVTITHVYAQ